MKGSQLKLESEEQNTFTQNQFPLILNKILVRDNSLRAGDGYMHQQPMSSLVEEPACHQFGPSLIIGRGNPDTSPV